MARDTARKNLWAVGVGVGGRGDSQDQAVSRSGRDDEGEVRLLQEQSATGA